MAWPRHPHPAPWKTFLRSLSTGVQKQQARWRTCLNFPFPENHISSHAQGDLGGNAGPTWRPGAWRWPASLPRPPVHPSIHPSHRPSVHPTICPSIPPSVHPSSITSLQLLLRTHCVGPQAGADSLLSDKESDVVTSAVT